MTNSEAPATVPGLVVSRGKAMKVKELKAVLASADDEADVIVAKHTTVAGGGLMKINPLDVFEATEAIVQPSGKVSVQYDASRKSDF